MSFIQKETNNTVEGYNENSCNMDTYNSTSLIGCDELLRRIPQCDPVDNFREFLEEAHRTQLFEVYCDATRAAASWLTSRYNGEQEIPTDLANVLKPFQDRIRMLDLDLDIHFRMMNNLDAWFFGIKNVFGFMGHEGVWWDCSGNPIAGTIQPYNNLETFRLVAEHGIFTMTYKIFCDQNKEKVLKKQKERELKQEAYIRMVARLLDENNC